MCDAHGERGKGTTLLNIAREIISMRVAAMQRHATANDNREQTGK